MGTNTITYLDRTFDAHDVISGNAYYARPLNSASLEIDTFSFDVQSDDTSLTEFIRNTPLTFYHDGNQMGIFYVQTISRTSINTYHFTCTSAVGLLDETYHDGGIYTGETVREVCTEICKPLTCYVKSNIANIKLYGWLPIATRRENLTQVLFAVGATLKVDYNGAIRIEGLWDGQSSEITASEMYAGGSVKYATPVTEVIVTEHAYSQSATETTELFKGTTSAGDKITFDEPCYDLAASGFSILASGANWATVSAGSGVLTGKKYTHVTRQAMQQIKPKIRELVTQSDNTVKVESATLVSLVNATAVAKRLAEYYSHNERINYKIATKREVPGDVVKITHPYGGEATGCIENVDITVSGKLAAEESVLVGYKPQDIGEQEYYDTVEVLTNTGIWTAPENVTSARIVLIGGGQGGSCGNKGEDGDKEGKNNAGGAGGLGGAGGAGGKIYIVNIQVAQGTTYAIVIGTGGTGGIYSDGNEVAGSLGGDTTFGNYTSADGSTSSTGYTDTTTGTFYANTGNKGVSGGAGGAGGQKGVSRSENGEDVGTYKGGKGSTSTEGVHLTYGGGGGGAAMGNDGKNGAVSDYYGDGGAGGNATIIPEIPVTLGMGGTGGAGGGGGGGCATGTRWRGTGGTGGAGSNGGDGAPGCVLIYYRLPKALSASGAVHDKNGKIISDKYGRRLVV